MILVCFVISFSTLSSFSIFIFFFCSFSSSLSFFDSEEDPDILSLSFFKSSIISFVSGSELEDNLSFSSFFFLFLYVILELSLFFPFSLQDSDDELFSFFLKLFDLFNDSSFLCLVFLFESFLILLCLGFSSESSEFFLLSPLSEFELSSSELFFLDFFFFLLLFFLLSFFLSSSESSSEFGSSLFFCFFFLFLLSSFSLSSSELEL